MKRIKQLRQEHQLSLRDLSKELDIAYSSLGKYERGEQQPNFETLVKIANYFHVTTDYLLELTETKSTNLEISYMSDYLGLTERSIHELHAYNNLAPNNPQVKQKLNTLNMLFTTHCELLEKITDYLNFSATHFKNFYDNTNNALSPISNLELWDDIEKTGYSDDWDLWSKALLLIVEEELLQTRKRIQSEKMLVSYSDSPNNNNNNNINH